MTIDETIDINVIINVTENIIIDIDVDIGILRISKELRRENTIYKINNR